MLMVRVSVYRAVEHVPFIDFVMDHDDIDQRRTLGEQIRNAFFAGQGILTRPLSNEGAKA